MTTNSRYLPPKEASLFRSIVKFYELKQYKKGLKAADSILKKFPEHGETLAMKGLTVSCMHDRKSEAMELVRLGLRHDLRSHVCWHVYGLLYRADRNYCEAIKCYRNALRLDPENVQILRDLYLLQIQVRDLKGFAETRKSILTLIPNNRNNWVGLAVAHHLLGSHQMALDVIDKYLNTLNRDRPASYEDSELYMYQNQLLYECGEYSKCLDHLIENQDQILDSMLWKQKKAQVLMQLKRYEEATAVYTELLEINPDNNIYHHGIQCALLRREDWFVPDCGVMVPVLDHWRHDPEKKEMESILYQYYTKKHEAAMNFTESPVWMYTEILLLVAWDEALEALLDQYLQWHLCHGVPSVGSQLKKFYKCTIDNDGKVGTLQRLLLSYLNNLDNDTLPALPSLLAKKPSNNNVSISNMLLWTRYLVAQHYDRLGDYVQALKYIDQCIESAPKVLDFHQRKARILKHKGDIQTAADVMEEARLLDLSDRYSNNKATKYLLAAERTEKAIATIALFTRHEKSSQHILKDMQCMWYELSLGASYFRQQKYGLALKQYTAVEKHFHDFIDDQFDFHTYCIRKMTLRAYLQVLSFCDTIYKHKMYRRAAHGIISTYLSINQDRQSMDLSMNSLSLTEKKQAKRAQAKIRKAELQKKSNEEKNTVHDKKNGNIVKDPDPLGEELLKKPFLEEAWKRVSVLQEYASDHIETHLAAFDTAVQKKKILLCLKAILKGKNLLSVDDKLIEEWRHRCSIFQKLLQDDDMAQNPIIKAVLVEFESEYKTIEASGTAS